MARTRGDYDSLAIAGALFAGWSGHWLITPIQHPNASTAQYLTIWLQILAGISLALWANRKSKRLKGEAQTPSPS